MISRAQAVAEDGYSVKKQATRLYQINCSGVHAALPHTDKRPSVNQQSPSSSSKSADASVLGSREVTHQGEHDDQRAAQSVASVTPSTNRLTTIRNSPKNQLFPGANTSPDSLSPAFLPTNGCREDQEGIGRRMLPLLPACSSTAAALARPSCSTPCMTAASSYGLATQ